MRIKILVELVLSDRQFTRQQLTDDRAAAEEWVVEYVGELLTEAGKRHHWRPQVDSVEVAS